MTTKKEWLDASIKDMIDDQFTRSYVRRIVSENSWNPYCKAIGNEVILIAREVLDEID